MVAGKSWFAVFLCETLLLLEVAGPRSTGQLHDCINACIHVLLLLFLCILSHLLSETKAVLKKYVIAGL